ncbi:MAG: hypothetical protein D3920_08515 [Candidatus Electrothrix sp. AW2]|nr:hypothetical protein [Candidatus Electrothrix gigas]
MTRQEAKKKKERKRGQIYFSANVMCNAIELKQIILSGETITRPLLQEEEARIIIPDEFIEEKLWEQLQ